MSAGPARSRRSGRALRAAAVFADDKVAQGALSMSECPSRGHRPARRLREESRLVLRGHQRLRSEHHTALLCSTPQFARGRPWWTRRFFLPASELRKPHPEMFTARPVSQMTNAETSGGLSHVSCLVTELGYPSIQHRWTDPSSQT